MKWYMDEDGFPVAIDLSPDAHDTTKSYFTIREPPLEGGQDAFPWRIESQSPQLTRSLFRTTESYQLLKMSTSRDVEKIMFKLCRLDPKDDLITYNGPEVKCDCGMRASRLMTSKFEGYFACPKWRCKFDKKLEVVAAENSVRWEMKATMREKLAELEARKDAEMAELEAATTAQLSLKEGYIKEKEHQIEVIKMSVRLAETRNEILQRRLKSAEEEFLRYRHRHRNCNKT